MSAQSKHPVDLKAKLAELQRRIDARRVERKDDDFPVPADPSLRCQPDCEVCAGLGLVRYHVRLDDHRFGKLFPCPNMPLERLHSPGHFGLYWDEHKLLSWETLWAQNGIDQAVGAVQATLERGWGWVYLHGDYGTAKSQLLKVAVAENARAGVQAYYVRMVDLMDQLRACYDQDHAGSALVERIEQLCEMPVLALDEIDRIKQTDWVQERLFQLLDRRYSAALTGRGVTLIASNASPDQLEPYLRSRVLDGRFRVVHLSGLDMRPGMR